MSDIKKELTKKQKIILYTVAAAASVAVAIGATFLLIVLLKNPPDFVFKNDSPAYSSRLSTLSNFDNISLDTTEQQSNNSSATSSSTEELDPTKVVVNDYAVDTSKLTKRKYQIPIKSLLQNPELPSGSEVTALTTVLNFYGYDVSKTEIDNNHLVKSSNKNDDFYKVYIGDPASDGLGCYAKPIVDAANSYINSNNKIYTSVDYSGTEFEKLLKFTESDVPVIIWGTTYNEQTLTLNEARYADSWTVDGKNLQWIQPEHCMVLIGYNLDNHTAIVSDPLRGIVEYDLDTVKARYLALKSQCVILKQRDYAPITGINNGGTYYTTQCVNVTQNKNIASITLNDAKVGYAFLLTGNQNETYDIVITYKDGSTVKYTAYTKPISDMMDSLLYANEFTVNENDIKTINEIKKTAQSAERKYSPYSETEALESIISVCDLMLSNINSANEKFNAAKEKAAKYENKALSISDLEALVSFSNELEALKMVQNLSIEQKTELLDIYEKCSGWLASLQIVE